jgi:hypothetical protein
LAEAPDWGLSVVHGIVTGHGGKITVRSTPGEGTEFTLSFPALDQHETRVQAEAAAGRAYSAGHRLGIVYRGAAFRGRAQVERGAKSRHRTLIFQRS